MTNADPTVLPVVAYFASDAKSPHLLGLVGGGYGARHPEHRNDGI
jgi:hypothetical protein